MPKPLAATVSTWSRTRWKGHNSGSTRRGCERRHRAGPAGRQLWARSSRAAGSGRKRNDRFRDETVESCRSPASFRPIYSAPPRSLRSGRHMPRADLRSLIKQAVGRCPNGSSVPPQGVDAQGDCHWWLPPEALAPMRPNYAKQCAGCACCTCSDGTLDVLRRDVFNSQRFQR